MQRKRNLLLGKICLQSIQLIKGMLYNEQKEHVQIDLQEKTNFKKWANYMNWQLK